MNQFLTLAFLVFINTNLAQAETSPTPTPISLFGTKPIQLSVESGEIKKRKEPGHICDIDATIGGGHYSAWGETEKDARTIVMKECSDKSGLLICKEKNITCKQDK